MQEQSNNDRPGLERAQPDNENHTWIFVLLLCAVMLMIGVFGFAVFSIYSGGEESAEEVQEEVLPEVEDTQGDEEIVVDDEEENSDSEIEFYNTLPSFSAPASLHAVIREGSQDSYYRGIVSLSNEPIVLCEGCDGPPPPITVTLYSENFADAPTPEKLRDGFKDVVTGEPSADLTESTRELTNGTLFTISGTTEAGLIAPYFSETLLFISTDGQVAKVTLSDFNDSEDLRTSWNIVKNSLNFRAI